MDHDEMVELLESLETAKDVLVGSEHNVALGRDVDPADAKLWKAARTFVKAWRKIAVDEVERAIAAKARGA